MPRRGDAGDPRNGEVTDNDSVASSLGPSEDGGTGDRRRQKPKSGVTRRRVGKARTRERQRGETLGTSGTLWGHRDPP